MYENDLYNINFGDDMDQNQTENEPAEPTEPTEQPSEPNGAEPKENEPATSTNPQPKAEPKEPQSSSPQDKVDEYKITKEQHDYLEKARQKDELNQVVNDIKSRNPDFDFDLVAKKLLKMNESDQKKYYNPQGLELLWLREFAPNLAHNSRVDVAKNNASLDMDELTDKLSKGTQTMDEELQFYLNLK